MAGKAKLIVMKADHAMMRFSLTLRNIVATDSKSFAVGRCAPSVPAGQGLSTPPLLSEGRVNAYSAEGRTLGAAGYTAKKFISSLIRLIPMLLLTCPAFAHTSKSPAATSSLSLLPVQTTLVGPKATQRLLVEAKRDGRFVGDLSAKAVFVSSNPHVAMVGKDGVVRPVGDGTTKITATVGGRKASASVRVEKTGAPFVWNFRSHVLAVMTKAGCNSGACHGAAAGKGGLKLTLRGFDPVADYAVLTRQARGRRVVSGDPAHSLMLLKPTMTIGHGGGERIKRGSADYAVLAGWIQAGVPKPKPDDPRLQTLEVLPESASLHPGDAQQILVRAHFSDRHTEDVTRWVKFGTSDSTVATVDDGGQVRVMGRGEAAITVWFSSKVTYARVVSPYPAALPALAFTATDRGDDPEFTFIDDLILKKLRALNIPPSPRCSDNEFIRRAYLDADGILPTPQETDAFLADAAPDKRRKLVDALLKRSEFTDYWTYKWCDLLLVSSRKMNGDALNAFYTYIRKSVETNKPWNTFAREILTARGSNLDNGAANYYVMHKDPIDLSETTTQTFLGMSITCARCHNHPLEKWTQRDYYQMANLFSRVRLKNGDRGNETLVLAAADGNIDHPRLGIPLPPRPLDGREMALDDPGDRRRHLADWVVAPENPYFARALVNRVWRCFMGRGLVEAEDDLRLTNPPSNPELLDTLATDFSRHGYDVKRFIRAIMNSAAYQRSANPVGINAKDERYYSRYIVRRLPAEVILDTLSQVTGIPTEFPNTPKGTRALQLHDSQVASYFLSAFGRPERERTCACERQQEPNVAQALHLSNGDTVNMKLRAAGGTIDRLLNDKVSDEQALRQVYLAALCRFPIEPERNKALAILAEAVSAPNGTPTTQREARRAVLEDLFWAILTDREFLFNH
jgi:hypothetical protein